MPVILDTKEYITDTGVAESNVKLVKRGTLLMSFKLTIGRTAIAGRDLYTNEAIAAVVPKADSVDTTFLSYVLPIAAHAGDVDQAVKGRTLNKSKLLRLDMLLPPPHEQKRIAAVLSSVDEAIQATQAVIEQKRRVKDGLLQELLTRGVRTTRFRQSNHGQIPHHWEIATPGELATFTGGYGFCPPDWSMKGLPIIRIQNLNGSSKFNYYDGPVREKWLVEPGDLLFAWAGSAGASFGPCIWPGPTGVLNQHIYKLTPNEGVDPGWLYAIMRLITSRVEERAHGFKATLLHVHKSDITGQLIPLPPYSEQRAISERLDAMTGSIEAGESELGVLREVKRGLLQDLLTGKVRVST